MAKTPARQKKLAQLVAKKRGYYDNDSAIKLETRRLFNN
jgi:hypothetical protein